MPIVPLVREQRYREPSSGSSLLRGVRHPELLGGPGWPFRRSQRVWAGQLVAELLPDQLDPVAIGIADEADAVALGAAAGAVGGLFGLDPQLRQAGEGVVEVAVDEQGDVVVAAAVLVAGDAVVVGELEARVFAGQGHEDVDRLLADRHPPHLFEAELLVEGDRAVDLADPVAGVEERGHRWRGYPWSFSGKFSPQ